MAKSFCRHGDGRIYVACTMHWSGLAVPLVLRLLLAGRNLTGTEIGGDAYDA
jgi:hypothetical protein